MVILLSILFFGTSLFAAPWSSQHSPLILDRNFSLNFDEDLTFGKVSDSRKAWPGSHWSNWQGGAAFRWSASNSHIFRHKLYTRDELLALYPAQLAELSATEKMDILKGDYNYSITRRELNRVSPNESKWHGICHGYAPAAVHHPEPQKVFLTNDDGIELIFYSGDVTALLSLYYAEFANSSVQFVGRRCKSSRGVRVWNRGSCIPLNAGSFHVALTNKLALQGEALIFDIEPSFEVWNFVAAEFESRYVATFPTAPESARNAVKRVLVQTEVKYAADTRPAFDPVLFTDKAYYIYRWYEYFLEIDVNDMIIGGEWVTDNAPDFMWNKDKADFTGPWSILNAIYRPIELIEELTNN